MKCEVVQKVLSPFLDEMLGSNLALEVSDHLGACYGCHKELNRLVSLRSMLGSLKKVEAPQYLRHLLQIRMRNQEQNSWTTQLRESLEYRWARIRSTERIWYLTRILGTATTLFFFLILRSAMGPISVEFPAQIADRGGPEQHLRQLGISVLKNLGLLPVEVQRRPISPSEPRINALYLLNFGQSVSRSGSDDSFSVVTVVDRRGTAKIQNVLEYPADSSLLYDFNTMIASARCRPASQNGKAVDSHLVLAFNKISVND